MALDQMSPHTDRLTNSVLKGCCLFHLARAGDGVGGSTWALYLEYMNLVLFSVCSSDSADDALCCKKTADRFVVYRSADILLFLGFYRIFPRLFFLGFVSAGGTGYIPSVTCRCVLVCVNLNSSVCAGSGRSANQYTWKSLKFFS